MFRLPVRLGIPCLAESENELRLLQWCAGGGKLQESSNTGPNQSAVNSAKFCQHETVCDLDIPPALAAVFGQKNAALGRNPTPVPVIEEDRP